jgi:hypothetical protein
MRHLCSRPPEKEYVAFAMEFPLWLIFRLHSNRMTVDSDEAYYRVVRAVPVAIPLQLV